MKFVDEFRNDSDIKNLAASVNEIVGDRELKFMEVCGTHTMAIARFAISNILPENVKLISGPGCPVCVTPGGYVDSAIDIANKDVTITTFGDMIRVPGSFGSLANARANGSDIRIIYSPMDALEIAKNNGSQEVVFLGVGFETTTPTIAATIKQAKKENIQNFSVLTSHKLVPPALEALMSEKIAIDGFLLPGHVSAIIGKDGYEDLFNSFKVPMSVAGFEPTDILLAVRSLVLQCVNEKPELEIIYKRVVHEHGNQIAKKIVNEVFEVADAYWRGVGVIPRSGLELRSEYLDYDAAKKFDVEIKNIPEPKGCMCGDILKGLKSPIDCPLFGKKCTPLKPVGPCMVSSEGTCAAYYKYGRIR